jgi:hypothetical protein
LIADIDDILRVTKIYQPAEGLKNSFALPYVPWMNMPAVLSKWQDEVQGLHIHYLTTTPIKVTPFYESFIYANYPLGSFDIRYALDCCYCASFFVDVCRPQSFELDHRRPNLPGSKGQPLPSLRIVPPAQVCSPGRHLEQRHHEKLSGHVDSIPWTSAVYIAPKHERYRSFRPLPSKNFKLPVQGNI